MRIGRRTAAVATLTAVLLAGGLVWAAQGGGSLQVTVHYEGSDGDVSATTPISVAVFSSPPEDESALPIGLPQAVQENGGTVTFENLTTSPVYLVAFFGDALTGPPSSGTPMGIHGILTTGAPGGIEVGNGETVEVELRFDDTIRMP